MSVLNGLSVTFRSAATIAFAWIGTASASKRRMPSSPTTIAALLTETLFFAGPPLWMYAYTLGASSFNSVSHVGIIGKFGLGLGLGGAAAGACASTSDRE